MLAATELSYDHRARLLDGSREIAGDGERFFNGTLAIEAGLRLPRRFALDVRLPLYWKSLKEPNKEAKELLGPGDLELVATYDVLAREKWHATVGVGLAFPTGATSAQPFAGSIVPTPLQLGTGTFDPLFTASGSFHPITAVGINAGVNARPVLYANSYAYQAASVITAALGGEYRFLAGRISVGLDLEYAHTTHASVSGSEVPNTGRDVLYLSPRFRARVVQRLYAELGLRIPVYQQVNATQIGETVFAQLRILYIGRHDKPAEHDHDEHDHDHEHEHENIARQDQPALERTP